MYCKRHMNLIETCDLVTNECKICGGELLTSSSPMNTVCKECSEEHEICELCGFDANE